MILVCLVIIICVSRIHILLSADIIPISQIVTMEDKSLSIVLRLRSYTHPQSQAKGKNAAKFLLKILPSYGSIYQLSQVYSTYGYPPEKGPLISNNNSYVTGSLNRAVYQIPSTGLYYNNRLTAYDTIYFTVNVNAAESYAGRIIVTKSSGEIIGSDFLFSNENWVIVGNKNTGHIFSENSTQYASYEPSNRGQLLNHYIYGSDDHINSNHGIDSSLWYFQAPSKFQGNYGLAYNGYLSFSLASLAGNFDQLNGRSVSHQHWLIDCVYYSLLS